VQGTYHDVYHYLSKLEVDVRFKSSWRSTKSPGHIQHNKIQRNNTVKIVSGIEQILEMWMSKIGGRSLLGHQARTFSSNVARYEKIERMLATISHF